MESFHEYMNEYRNSWRREPLIRPIRDRDTSWNCGTYFQNKYPDYVVSGSIYYGYMDRPIFPSSQIIETAQFEMRRFYS